MKIIKAATLLGALALSSMTAFAQSSSFMRVSVPFSFMVGAQKFDAGEYGIQTVTETGVIYIQGAGHTAAVITSPLSIADPESKPSLVFENTVEGERLVKIQMEGEPSRSVPYHGNVSHVKLAASR